MKEHKPYRVTVYGIFSKDILVNAESENDAIDYVQSICDNTDLISFEKSDLVDISAEDVFGPEDVDCICPNCMEKK